MRGHIKKRTRADGTASYQARIPSPTNRHKDIVKTFDRKRDAERWLSEQAAAIGRGDFIDPRSTARPFRDLVATWERTRAAGLAPKTRERYSSITRTYLLPEFGSTPVGKMSRASIKEWFADLAEAEKPDGSPLRKPGTLRKVQVVLSSILSEGVELGLIRENPAARLRLATPVRKDMMILTAAEVRALAEAIAVQGDTDGEDTARYRKSASLAVYTAAYTGLRAGELWALQRRDLDLPGRRLVVGRTLQDERGNLTFSNTTKTDGSRRVIGLPVFLANMLTTHLDGLPADPTTLVFTARDGGPVRHGLFVRRVFRPAAAGRAASLARYVPNGDGSSRRPIPARPAVPAALPEAKQAVRFHDLRHTCASILIAGGRNALEIKTQLGHASITTTMDRYGHLFPSAFAGLADALDAAYDAGNVVPIEAADGARAA